MYTPSGQRTNKLSKNYCGLWDREKEKEISHFLQSQIQKQNNNKASDPLRCGVGIPQRVAKRPSAVFLYLREGCCVLLCGASYSVLRGASYSVFVWVRAEFARFCRVYLSKILVFGNNFYWL